MRPGMHRSRIQLGHFVTFSPMQPVKSEQNHAAQRYGHPQCFFLVQPVVVVAVVVIAAAIAAPETLFLVQLDVELLFLIEDATVLQVTDSVTVHVSFPADVSVPVFVTLCVPIARVV